MQFEGKTVVITAGASGMGRRIAQRMSERGANTVIADINREQALELAAQLPSSLAVHCDVRDSVDVERARDGALERFGAVDVVMSHAGIATAGLVHEISETDWQRMLDVNVVGMARVVRAFLPHMLERGSGHFIMTSSSLALLGGHPVSALAVPYIASKAAVIGLAQAVATAHASEGINVTLFAPDATDTGWSPEPAAGEAGSRAGQVAAGLPRYARQTPEQAADVLMAALDAGSFLASATPDHRRLLRVQADALLDPSALWAEYEPDTAAHI
ncbi:SDR family NAD(P)-dependent oxidoreductase [Streptomyces longwoodensis]|uniref:SDR family oxidoreductase n=1 Tax=Streptomyces longwoodensis TaxID=68231 RepID=UPI00340BF3CF